MTIQLNVPPTIHELLDHELYKKKVILTVPRTKSLGNDQWQVWGHKHDGKWGQKRFSEYRDAVKFLLQCAKDRAKFRDVALTCRPLWIATQVEWEKVNPFAAEQYCGRCRRPSLFVPERGHHALRDIVTWYDSRKPRCFYCGITEDYGVR